MTTLNGIQIHEQSLFWCSGGSWRHDCVLTEGQALSKGDAATIVSGSLTLKGKVKRSNLDAVDRPHVVTVGGLGWHDLVKSPLSFQNDGGIKLRSILKILAQAADETIEMPADSVIGEYFEVVAATEHNPITYADVLTGMVRDGSLLPWHVDADGVTRFGSRTVSEVTARATITKRNEGIGIWVYSLDDPGQFIPENTIHGRIIDRLHLTEIAGKLTAHVYAPDSVDPIDDQIHRILMREFADRVRTYVVSECHADGRCDLAVPPDATHLPEMRNVEQWMIGPIIHRAAKGDEVVVSFRDWKRTKPVIIGFKLSTGTFLDIAPKGATVDVLLPPMVVSGTMIIGGVTTPFTGVAMSPIAKTLGSVTIGSTKAGIKL
jgi:hypothetical protein